MTNQDFIIYFSEREQNDLSGMAKWFRRIGLTLLLLGVLSVVLPYVATLAVNILVAVVLLVAGVTQLAHAINVRKWRAITWEMLTALVFLITGGLFVFYPWSGMLALTMLLGIFFLVIGAFKILFSLAWRMRPGWGWILAAGILSLLLGFLVISGLPATAVWVIGLILGIDLIFSGIALMALGSKIKGIVT